MSKIKFFCKGTSDSDEIIIEANLSDSVICIIDSYRIKSKKVMKQILEYIYENYLNSSLIEKRGINSMISEWRVHNMLYAFGLFRKRTRTVDFEYPQKKILTFTYKVLSIFYWHH